MLEPCDHLHSKNPEAHLKILNSQEIKSPCGRAQCVFEVTSAIGSYPTDHIYRKVILEQMHLFKCHSAMHASLLAMLMRPLSNMWKVASRKLLTGKQISTHMYNCFKTSVQALLGI